MNSKVVGASGLSLKNDLRADPQMVAALAEFGLDELTPPPPVTADSSLEEILEFIVAAETNYQQIFDTWFDGLPPVDGMKRRTQSIRAEAGHEISLHIHEPAVRSGPIPCVYHIHGGGMVLLKATDSAYVRWRDELAATGMVVVGVEFRNAGGELGYHPFPAGLDDCASGLQWTNDHRQDLDISKIVVAGESGGGNLSLALTLKCKVAGSPGLIDGTYAMCPYISNSWAQKAPELPSLFENDDYFVSCRMMGAFALAYDPELKNSKNPLCWPYLAETDDLHGLNPHVISVNELDPLRDEGLKYYQKLLQAGVTALGRTVNGTCHAADMLFRKACPAIYGSTVRDIRSFAGSL